MACYTIDINNQRFKISSPENGGETPLQNLLIGISQLKNNDPKEYKKFITAFTETRTNPKIKKPDHTQNKKIPDLIKANLSKSGITMHVLTEQEWAEKIQEIGADPNARSYFYNGEIYVRREKFSVDDAIHELSHLILAVMKAQDFSKYRSFINTFYNHDGVQEIAKNLKKFGRYSQDFELDFKEEAIVRYLEGIFTGDESYIQQMIIDGEEVDTLNYLNNVFRDTIKTTFGIQYFPGVGTFFKTLLSDVPQYGSDMFTLRPMESIGFHDLKFKAIEATNISALINYYLSDEGGHKIQEGPCQ